MSTFLTPFGKVVMESDDAHIREEIYMDGDEIVYEVWAGWINEWGNRAIQIDAYTLGDYVETS